MKDTPRTEDQLLPYETIEAATKGYRRHRFSSGTFRGLHSDIGHTHALRRARLSVLVPRPGTETPAGDETDRPRPQVQARIINRRPVCTPFHTGRLLDLNVYSKI